MNLRVHSYESFGAVDGPGIRLVIFLQGCPLRCIFCHNPDTWSVQGGTDVPLKDIVWKAQRMRPYLGEDGGVTFSGGEPLLQAEAVLEATHALQAIGIHVALDTSAGIDPSGTYPLLEAVDLLLLDVKSPDPVRFKEVTGVSQEANRRIFDYLRKTQKPVWIRQVVAQGLNDTPAEKEATKAYISGLNIQRIDRLPYHELGIHKYEALGLPYRGEQLMPPTQEGLLL